MHPKTVIQIISANIFPYIFCKHEDFQLFTLSEVNSGKHFVKYICDKISIHKAFSENSYANFFFSHVNIKSFYPSLKICYSKVHKHEYFYFNAGKDLNPRYIYW